MAHTRSLELSTYEIEVNCNGKMKGKEEEKDFDPIIVTVDGETDNASFTVSGFNDYWFTYSVERKINSVQIAVSINKNLSATPRYGTIQVSHNCADITKTINILQKGAEYSISAEYGNVDKDGKHIWIFNTQPPGEDDENDSYYKLYEELTINVTAINGRGKWYVKEIQQYQVLESDEFKDLENEYDGSQEIIDKISQVRVEYDGAFQYYIEDNKLVVRSYGRIDLAPTHMRYFFVLCHCDVDNMNKKYLDENNVTYQIKKLFVFN